MTTQSPTDLAGPVPNQPPANRLAGRVCLVVGATKGIGRATALRMAAEGAAAVAIAGRSAALGEQLAEELNGLGSDSLFVPTDVTRDAELARMVEQAAGRYGRLDAVFNNAGFQERRALLAEQPESIYDQVFDTNVRAIFNAMRHEIPAMLETGGAIVNTTSVSGFRNPYPGFSLYNASKAAAIALTRTAALEYAPHGIRINSVAPGPGCDGDDAGGRSWRHATRGRGIAAPAYGTPGRSRHGRGLVALRRSELHRWACALRGRRLPGGVSASVRREACSCPLPIDRDASVPDRMIEGSVRLILVC